MMNYIFEFEKYIHAFMKEHRLFPLGKSYLALSGGADSMALAHLFISLKRKKLIADLIFLHVNHGTRKECDLEDRELSKFSKDHGIPFISTKLTLDLNSSNFELRAKKERESFFNKYVTEKDAIYYAHHLDDSFEWHLMKKFSSSTDIPWGLACRKRNVFRPFLCVSKNHILKYLQKTNALWFEDKSNLDNHFERNFVRNVMIPKIKERYPKYLKHYAYQANNSLIKKSNYKVKRLGSLSFILYKGRFSKGLNVPILKEFRRLSNRSKSKVAKRLQEVEGAVLNGRKGPMQLGGGVSLYLFKGAIILVNTNLLHKETSEIPVEGFFIKGPGVKGVNQHPFFDLFPQLKERGLVISSKFL